ncbi:hypothetical protein B5V88_10480 [Heyndrickxia sporothermodurans]|uniref:Four helix bundle protein n=1 Tax=Heyndrickxia sporothermodurans TaxID=46224 RepID=A0AB37HPH2_9BACI|nr:hypothetical protein [Heyndrickxia sporothermodurans]MBL5768650.1 hypothetical protein [Heyndrickxia sporothermodurans]MBL5772286.1 hypothetical protein [Heyndrickxia sporothermodurans]MBL5775837.1 hypothetical protein [Heyndrickxia sporothermodurans]MBL5779371.1 hypothetical protein [Heyndrickxia sporothermodurans]MBL5782445.1 hypothetical protein [Heyndrickxia sporothermodurans]
MRTEVDSFRKLNLYKQALRFTHMVLQYTEQNRDEIGLRECLEIRKQAMEIPKNIATAASEINVKNKYKKLNRSKEAFQTIMGDLKRLGMDKSEKKVIMLSLELLKLFNGYFGMLNRKKNVRRG